MVSKKISDTVAEFIFDKIRSIKSQQIRQFIFSFIDDFEFDNSIPPFLRQFSGIVTCWTALFASYFCLARTIQPPDFAAEQFAQAAHSQPFLSVHSTIHIYYPISERVRRTFDKLEVLGRGFPALDIDYPAPTRQRKARIDFS